MTQFAIDEVPSLLSKVSEPIDERSPIVRYLCALFAELAYYHIPQWEIDNKKRAKLIPCNAYQELISHGVPTNAGAILQQLDLPGRFVVADRGTVAVGIRHNRFLFVGIRGTASPCWGSALSNGLVDALA